VKRPLVLLAVLVAVGAAVRAAGALAVPAPWIAPDEMIYGLLGRSLWEHARLAILGGPTPFYSFLYPALAGLPLRIASSEAGYDAVQVIQAVVMASTAVVVYFWARSLARTGWALTGAALTLALPALAYSGMLMSDVLFLPLATLAAWLGARALEAPSVQRQALLLAALAACALTRLEANVLLIAVVAAALWLRRMRALRVTWIVLGVCLVGWIALHAGSPLGALGGYRSATGNYDALRAIEYVLYHAGDALLVTGVVPVLAVALLALSRPDGARLRASLAMIVSLLVVTVVEVGVFAAGNTGHLTERTLELVVPALLVGFVVWLDRGLPRPRGLTLWLAVIAILGIALLPFGRLAVPVATQDNPSLVPFIHLGGTDARIAWIVLGLVAVGAFVLMPRRLAWVLPVGLGALFVAGSVSASREFVRQSKAERTQLLGPDARWIDRAAGGPVTFFYDGDPYWNIVWAQLYANRRLAAVIDHSGTYVPGPLPQRELKILPPSGELDLIDGTVADAPLVVASNWNTFRGRRLASTPLPTADTTGLTLWRLDAPPRVDTLTAGMQPNGDIAQQATLTVYDCQNGSFQLTAFGKADETVNLAQDGAIIQTAQLTPGAALRREIAFPRGPAKVCTFTVSSSGLLGTTRFRFLRRNGPS
jgi:Dolichyl-phosphate-mannose-protein mannosyltransferase